MIILALLLPFPVVGESAGLTAWAATLTYRGCVELADKTLSGLSGITREGEGDTYLAVSDNSDRVARIEIRAGEDGSIDSVTVVGHLRLGRKLDREGIAYDARGRRFFVSDESPAIAEHRADDGRFVRNLTVPEIFRRHTIANQGLESLTLSHDGRTLWTANERALAIDGNTRLAAEPMGATTRVRLLRYDLRGDPHDAAFTPAAQYEYVTSGVHDVGGQVGLCDLVALPDDRLLALERSGAMNFRRIASIRTRISLVDLAHAAEVSGRTLATAPVTATSRSATREVERAGPADQLLLFDGFVCNERGANLEGLCLGRQLASDRWSVLGVVDSGDGGLGLSRSSIVAFELDLAARATTRSATTTRAAGETTAAPTKPR